MKLPSRRVGTVAALVVGLGVLALFLLLFAYAHPQNDDWGAAVSAQRRGPFGATGWALRVWGGRYASTLVNVLTPLACRSVGIWRLAGALYALALPFGIWAVVSVLAPSTSGRAERLAVAAVLSAALYAGMPNPAGGLYWMNGAVCYGLAEALALLTVAALLTAERADPQRQRAWTVAAAAVALVAAGMNEVTSLLLIGTLAVTLAARRHGGRSSARVALILGVVVVGFGAVLLMPGTRARLAAGGPQGGRHLLPLLAQAATVAARQAARWSASTPVLPVAILMGLGAARLRTLEPAWRLPHPALVAVTALGAYVGTALMPLFGQGEIPAHTLNLLHAVFVGGTTLTAACAGAWGAGRNPASAAAPRWAAAVLIAAAVALALLPGSALRVAGADLFTGRVARFDAAMEARYAVIARCGPVCDVPRIEDPPRTLLWFEDAVDEANDTPFFREYKDRSYARYFGKKRIRLAPPATAR